MKTTSIPVHIARLAARVGAPLSDRVVRNDFIYNGKDIATLHVDIWFRSVNCQGVKYEQRFSDSWLLHEIAHFLVASPLERQFPEYGCNSSGLFGANGNVPMRELYTNPGLLNNGVLTEREQFHREIRADLLGVAWQKRLGVPVVGASCPTEKYASHEELPAAVEWLRSCGFIELAEKNS